MGMYMTNPSVKKVKSPESVSAKAVKAPAPVPEPVPEPVAPVAKRVKKSQSPKVEEPKVNEVVSSVSPVSCEASLSDSFSGVVSLLGDLNSTLANTKLAVKTLEKMVSREMKVLDKINLKKNKNKGTRAPSGFVKPTKISDELAVFLKKEKGTLMARTEVTKEMTAYIREKSLQDKENGRKILPDAPLKKLLNLGAEDVLTYFNLQKFMSPHFEKSVKA
jgi:hypothetical protein